MHIRASVSNRADRHEAVVETGGDGRWVTIPPKKDGPGSSVNGGELLFLALATCYCNDVYREAAREGLTVDHVEVTVDGHFEGRGSAATDVTYAVRVSSPESRDAIEALLRTTDDVAEVHNTLRRGAEVELASVEVVPRVFSG